MFPTFQCPHMNQQNKNSTFFQRLMDTLGNKYVNPKTIRLVIRRVFHCFVCGCYFLKVRHECFIYFLDRGA